MRSRRMLARRGAWSAHMTDSTSWQLLPVQAIKETRSSAGRLTREPSNAFIAKRARQPGARALGVADAEDADEDDVAACAAVWL